MGPQGHWHHILPKAVYPEFEDFQKNPWNRKPLSHADHLTAHYLLFRALPEEAKIYTAFFWMVAEALFRADFTDSFVGEIAARYQTAWESGLSFPWTKKPPIDIEDIE